MSEPISSIVGGQPISQMRAGNWRAALGGFLGTCALVTAPMQAAAATSFSEASSSLFAGRSLLLASSSVENPVPQSPVLLRSERRLAEEPTEIVAERSVPSGDLLAASQPSDYHVGRFKADIARLRRERWVASPVEAFPRVTESEAQPAWQALLPSAAPVQASSSIFPWLTLRGLEVARIASNSVDAGSGLDIFQAPVGRVVVPQLPPLDAPETYLPESPDRFNGYIWPARGTITSGYGYRWGRLHRGIDIAGPVGSPILAASSGEVISAGWSGGYGKLVKLKHQDGSITYYAHNSRILVRTGQQVRQGQQVAALGNTGRSTGPHLHFEIHTGKGSVNPLALLPKKR